MNSGYLRCKPRAFSSKVPGTDPRGMFNLTIRWLDAGKTTNDGTPRWKQHFVTGVAMVRSKTA